MVRLALTKPLPDRRTFGKQVNHGQKKETRKNKSGLAIYNKRCESKVETHFSHLHK
jgi:hypothetical protein